MLKVFMSLYKAHNYLGSRGSFLEYLSVQRDIQTTCAHSVEYMALVRDRLHLIRGSGMMSGVLTKVEPVHVLGW